MGESFKAEIFDASKGTPPNPKEMPADQAAKLAEQSKTVIGRATASSEKNTPVPAERPEWLPEKFKTVEEFSKAYAELEKKLGSKPVAEAGKQPVEAPKGTDALKVGDKPAEQPKVPDAKAAEETVSKAGLNMSDLSKEFAQKGDLSEDSYKKLESVGIDKATVGLFIEGQKAIQEQRMADLESVAGGHDQFQQMHTWSAQNLSDPEKMALNKVIETGDHTAIKTAFAGIHAKWVAAGQNEPVGQIVGRKADAAPADVYKFRSEMVADMRKPDYQKSEAFRAAVHAKAARSNIL